MKIENMQQLFEHGLAQAYDGEQQLVKALEKMAQASSSARLRMAFEQHREETRRQAERLEQVFTALGKEADAEKNPVIREMISVGEKIISSTDASPVRDAALIKAGNEVEHVEMAMYGSLRDFAQLLGHTSAARLLEQTRNEEKAADELLTEIAENSVNREALGAVQV
jgi:ferritin-like metal-binding protein YciE